MRDSAKKVIQRAYGLNLSVCQKPKSTTKKAATPEASKFAAANKKTAQKKSAVSHRMTTRSTTRVNAENLIPDPGDILPEGMSVDQQEIEQQVNQKLDSQVNNFCPAEYAKMQATLAKMPLVANEEDLLPDAYDPFDALSMNEIDVSGGEAVINSGDMCCSALLEDMDLFGHV